MSKIENNDVFAYKDMGIQRVSFKGFENNIIQMDIGVWNYGAIVSSLIRQKYSDSDVEAIVSNCIMLMQNPSSVSEEESNDKMNEFNEFQEDRNEGKARANELLSMGEERGIKEM